MDAASTHPNSCHHPNFTLLTDFKFARGRARHHGLLPPPPHRRRQPAEPRPLAGWPARRRRGTARRAHAPSRHAAHLAPRSPTPVRPWCLAVLQTISLSATDGSMACEENLVPHKLRQHPNLNCKDVQWHPQQATQLATGSSSGARLRAKAVTTYNKGCNHLQPARVAVQASAPRAAALDSLAPTPTSPQALSHPPPPGQALYCCGTSRVAPTTSCYARSPGTRAPSTASATCRRRRRGCSAAHKTAR